MSKKSYYSSFLKTSVALCLPVFFSFNAYAAIPSDIWFQKDNTPLLVINQTMKLIPKIINEKTTNYLIHIRYPQIMGNAKFNDAATNFNQIVKSLVDEKLTSFKQDIEKASKNMPPMQSYLKMNYQLAGFVSQSQKTEYISIRFGTDTFERGMAHPSFKTDVINYDLANNKALSLNDLFNPNSGYLEKIANYSMNQLRAKHLPDDMIKAGAGPNTDNYKNWNLTLKGLLITFDEGQVAPRVNGKQEILIPNSFLKDIVDHKTACTLGITNCDVT